MLTYISSIENQKAIITIQQCSIENQMGVIAVQVYGNSTLLVLSGTLLNSVNAPLVLSQRCGYVNLI